MNFLSFLIIFLSAACSFACPDFTGTYRWDKGDFSIYMKIQQDQCQSITIIPGPFKDVGVIPSPAEWSEVNKYTVLLDGTIHPSTLKISMQFEGSDLVESYSWAPNFFVVIYSQDQVGNLNIKSIGSQNVTSSSQIDRNLPGTTGTWLKVH